MLSSERTCSISISRNNFQIFLATKLIKQQQLQLKGKHLFVWNNIQYYPHSDIKSLRTLNTTLPALLHDHTDWIQYWYKQGDFGKPVELLQRFGLIHHVKKIAIRPVFLCSPLNFCLFLLYLNSIKKNVITTLLDQGK